MPSSDRQFIQKALKLADKGRGFVSPNPLVGAVIVKKGQLIASGHHQVFGGPHAEVLALKRAGRRARGATLYCNLEPCSHFGKTPPCTDAIIKAGIKRVVVATLDPNPLVSGRGVKKLRAAGIIVKNGLLAKEARSLNRIFFKYIQTRHPYVIMKIAQSADGFLTKPRGHSRWITGVAARRQGHRLRALSDAVLIGSRTAMIDDPALILHRELGRQPWRIVLSSDLKLPHHLQLFKDKFRKLTMLVTASRTPCPRFFRNFKILRLPKNKQGNLNLRKLLPLLGKMGVSSLLVEGGPGIHESFLRAGLVEELWLFRSPQKLGQGLKVQNLEKQLRFFRLRTSSKKGRDKLQIYLKDHTI